jgi:Tol biopolymer transport system component
MTVFEDQQSVRILQRDGSRQAMLPFERLTSGTWYDDHSLLLQRAPASLFVREVDVFLQPLASDGIHAAGEPRLLFSGLRGGGFSHSRDGRLAVYVANGDDTPIIWTVTLDEAGRPRAQQLPLGTAMVCGAAVSADGMRLALSISDGERVHLSTVDFGGGEPRSVAELARCVLPNWSPDGSKLAWREGKQLVIAASDGSAPRRLPLKSPSGDDTSVVWPRADRILYHVEGNRQWNVIDVASGAVTQLSDDKHGWYFQPLPSPDGNRVAVTWNRLEGERHERGGTWIVGLDGSQHFVSGPTSLEPVGWSGDGKQLIVRNDMRASDTQPLRLLRVPVEGGTPRAWATMPFSNRSMCRFARDGRRMVCLEYNTRSDVWLMENFDQLVAAAR